MPIYFLRHGQSESNVKKIFSDPLDDPSLTYLGIAQAKEAGEKLRKMGITKIFSSPRKRALQTAREVARIIGYSESDIIIDDRIIDYDAGVLNGEPFHILSPDELDSTEGAENIMVFQNRVLSSLREYKSVPGNIVIVSHSVVGLSIETARQNVDPHMLFSMQPYPNADPIELQLDWLE